MVTPAIAQSHPPRIPAPCALSFSALNSAKVGLAPVMNVSTFSSLCSMRISISSRFSCDMYMFLRACLASLPFSVDNEPIFAVAKASSPTTDYCRIVGMADGTMKIDMVVASANIFSMPFAAPTRRTVCRAAVRLKSGNFLAAINGVGGTVDTDAGDWSGFDTMYINRLNTSYSNVMARSVEVSSASLSDAQVIAASEPNDGGFI